MSEPIQSISQGNYLLQGTVATSAGIVGDGTTQNPLRADETVLFETTANAKTSAFTLSEPLTAFEKVRFEIIGYTNVYAENTHKTPSANNEEITTFFTYYCKHSDVNPLQMIMGAYSSNDGLNYGVTRSKFLYMNTDGTTWNGNTTDGPHIQKIVGINRIANN